MRQSILTLTLLACLLGWGCASVQTSAGKLLASTATTVDGAMQGWAIWVAQGHATAQQEAQVKTAYGQYQASMAIALGAYNAMVQSGDQSVWLTASQILASNGAAIVALVQSFTSGGVK
jgi:hypothetical protein